MLRRVSLAAVSLIFPALLALPAAAPAAVQVQESGDPVVVIVGDVDVPRGEAVDGVYLVSGDARIEGRVDGDVVVLSGDATVAGTIDGDLFVASGNTRVLPGAEITGDVEYTEDRPVVSLDAIVGGEVKEESLPDLDSALPVIGSLFFVWLALGVSAAILGILLILVAPRAADAVEARSRERLGPTIAIGVAVLIALPVLAVLAGITVLGLPLAIGLLLALLPVWAVAYCTSAWALGRRIVGPPHQRVLSYLAGLVILWALGLVPLIGGIVSLAATIFGLGLLGAAIGAARNPQPAPDPDVARTPGS